METNLLDRMLNTYFSGQTAVTVTLQNKIRITGKIKAFDSYVIMMEGAKREIIYRHAISSLAPALLDDQKRQPVPARPAPSRGTPKQQKFTAHKPHPTRQPAALSASGTEQGINNRMKEGLLKWMQEQKAAK